MCVCFTCFFLQFFLLKQRKTLSLALSKCQATATALGLAVEITNWLRAKHSASAPFRPRPPCARQLSQCRVSCRYSIAKKQLLFVVACYSFFLLLLCLLGAFVFILHVFLTSYGSRCQTTHVIVCVCMIVPNLTKCFWTQSDKYIDILLPVLEPYLGILIVSLISRP